MLHRHLDDPGYSLDAIDDIIERGHLQDWLDLRDAAATNPIVRSKLQTIVAARSGEQSTIWHDFWRNRLQLENSRHL